VPVLKNGLTIADRLDNFRANIFELLDVLNHYVHSIVLMLLLPSLQMLDVNLALCSVFVLFFSVL